MGRTEADAGERRVGVGGLPVSTDSPSSQRASTAAFVRLPARPSVDHIASIGDFGWDGMMAWRDGGREEQKTAWHAMPGPEGGEGPGGGDAMTDREG